MKLGESVRPTIRFIAPVHHSLAHGATTHSDVAGTMLRRRVGAVSYHQSVGRPRTTTEDTEASRAPVSSVVQPKPR